MADHKTFYPTIGGVWAAALDLWVQFAQGVFTSWSYEMSTLSTCYAVKVTVDLSGGGTDNYWLGALDTINDTYVMVRQIFESDGWRTMPQVILPDTVPGGTDVEVSFLNGPEAMRKDIPLYWSNANTGNSGDVTKSGPDGVHYFSCTFYVWKYNIVYVDAIGIMHGALTTADAMQAMPTDFIGKAPIIAVGGGGGSVDLTPVVDALNRIALIDVTYTFNNGGASFSMRGMVAAE